jgi:hypothetical protein
LIFVYVFAKGVVKVFLFRRFSKLGYICEKFTDS